MDAELLREMFRPFADGATPDRAEKITKGDLYDAGMSGGAGSAERRARFCSFVSLPDGISPNAMLSALNVIMSREEFYHKVEEFDNEKN